AIARLQTDVDDVRAITNLPAGYFGRLFPLLFGNHLLKEPRADHISALPNNERAIAVFRFDKIDAGNVGAVRRFLRRARNLVLNHLCDGLNVRGRSAAAAANEIQPAVIDKLFKLGRETGWSFGVLSFLVWQAGVWVAGDACRCEFMNRPDMVGHKLWTGCAIQA